MNPLDVFYARWNAAAALIGIPIFEVINTGVDLDDMPDLWAGALDQGDTRTDVTMGSNPWLETHGQIVVGMFAKSGTGRAALESAVDRVREVFQGYRTANDGVRFPQVIGPEDVQPEATGAWWHLAMRVPYIMQARRAEPLVP
jgi:hypothetical protein